MIYFLFALIELFSLFITVSELRGEVYSLAVFTGSTYLHSNFSWTGSFPINRCWHQKTRDTGLTNGEDRIVLRPLVLIQYRSVTDGRTDIPWNRQHLQSL